MSAETIPVGLAKLIHRLRNPMWAHTHGLDAILDEEDTVADLTAAAATIERLIADRATRPTEPASAPPADACPQCGREKARNVQDVLAGKCPKWWAITDKDADADCARHSAAPPADAGDREGAVEAIRGHVNRVLEESEDHFDEWHRQNGGETSRAYWKHRALEAETALATLTEKLASEQAALEETKRSLAEANRRLAEEWANMDATMEGWDALCSKAAETEGECDNLRAALAQAQADRERAAGERDAYYAAIADCLARYHPMAVQAERRDLVEFIEQAQDEVAQRIPLMKLNRWIGYIQGVLISLGCTDVLTERDWSRPLFRPLDFGDESLIGYRLPDDVYAGGQRFVPLAKWQANTLFHDLFTVPVYASASLRTSSDQASSGGEVDRG